MGTKAITYEVLKQKVVAINNILGLKEGMVGSLTLACRTGTQSKYTVYMVMPNGKGLQITGENNWVSATACMMFLEGYEKGFCRGCLNK